MEPQKIPKKRDILTFVKAKPDSQIVSNPILLEVPATDEVFLTDHKKKKRKNSKNRKKQEKLPIAESIEKSLTIQTPQKKKKIK